MRPLGMDTLARYAELSSTQLVKACTGSKDEKAWVEFIRRFQVVIAAAVLRTARQWGEPSSSHLDDLIQDTYLKVCDNDNRLLRSFQPQHEDSIYGFLKVVSANVVHDHFRSALAAKRGAGQAEAVLEPIHMDPKTAGADSFATVTQRLQLERVDKVLRQVTSGRDQERKRTIFWLRHRLGLTASEIAAFPSIGLTTEGVESVLLRLSIMIGSHFSSSIPHREVKAQTRKNRSKRLGVSFARKSGRAHPK
jgi:RNA polymerase sigma-70 factor (ECF subfamily)